jgi:hypothetical protein
MLYSTYKKGTNKQSRHDRKYPEPGASLDRLRLGFRKSFKFMFILAVSEGHLYPVVISFARAWAYVPDRVAG